MVSKKESQFITKDFISDSEFIRIFSPGLNSAISFSDFKSSLGVTGTIKQIGDPISTPVLQQLGSVYGIRNIETSKGVLSGVSAQNGVMLSLNFSQGNDGEKVIQDLSADSYVFKTLKGGSDIVLTDEGDAIEINYAPSATSKTVSISEVSDFPDPIAGVITLEPDTDYVITNDISTSNRFVIQRPNAIRASSSQMVTLTYTGNGNMFTGVDPSIKFINITISAPNGNIFSVTSPSFNAIVQMVECNVESCQTMGAIQNCFISRFSNVAFENLVLGGLTFSGVNQVLVIDTGLAVIGGGSLVDLGTSTFQTVSIAGGVIPSSAPGSFFLSGLPNSGNIVAGGLGTVINNKGFGSGTPLDGISPDDARWNFQANNNIPDTRPDVLLSFDTPTITALAAATPILINGSWAEERSSQMTGSLSGRATYEGEKSAVLPITLTLSCEPVSGTNKDVNIYLAKNGVVIPDSKVETTISSGSPKNQSVIWQDSFENSDYYEPFIESIDGTSIQVNTAKLRVN